MFVLLRTICKGIADARFQPRQVEKPPTVLHERAGLALFDILHGFMWSLEHVSLRSGE
jgi:hypothetical protein